MEVSGVFVLGRGETDGGREGEERPTGYIGRYRALDGSAGADLFLDFDSPHAMLVVGKRGYGKSYTLGVIAEELARADGVAPTLLDPMGIFDTLADPADDEPVPATVIDTPTVKPDALDPMSWCSLLALSPESGAGTLLWRAAREASTLDGMRAAVRETRAPDGEIRSALNHITLAESWGIFDEHGLDASTLAGGEATVLDLSGLDSAPMNAVCRAVGETLYHSRLEGRIDRLPWLLVDEAHIFFDGVAAQTLEMLLTRGRAPGASLVTATQRPSSIPAVGISQSDILVSHRLTARADLQALEAVQPTYLNVTLDERLPTRPGEVTIVDDATETVHSARIRRRETPHGGGSPRASDVVSSGGRQTRDRKQRGVARQRGDAQQIGE